MRGTHREISVRQWWRTTKQRFLGNSQKSLDARQKKTAVLGIILAVVFVAVLLFALGSGPSSVKAAPKEINSENTLMAGSKITDNTENWTLPEPYSTSLRNPTKIEVKTSAADTQSENTLRVQGIVYSSKKPSAIIANQVVFEGDSIEGTRIIKIERDSVEFEKDGKRWQRQVKE
jgi:type II secretory pathway component PulC